ncbi:hypothetical protein MKW94_011655, partial [Papaver nudicaule]|nr:hypothetical protein [Papaver nudicaule]
HEVPANSRRLSSSKLRRLVTQDELKKCSSFHPGYSSLSHDTQTSSFASTKEPLILGI